MSSESGTQWLVLFYQFPKGPDARRVKVWRRLQRVGAVAVKNSVYVLPQTDQSQEDLRWLLAELKSQGADGAILESRFVDGMTDQDVKDLFNAARAADYRQLREEIDAVVSALPDGESHSETDREAVRRALARGRRRLSEIEAIDFFAAPGRDAVQEAMQALAVRTSARKSQGAPMETMTASPAFANLKGRVWVTRRGVRVDRIASAWLIKRRIDPEARFKFVDSKTYSPSEHELRFDMFEAEFTHDGDRCTFEVLTAMAHPDDAALQAIGEIVHDIDLKDAKFDRAETEGVATLLSGIVAATEDDDRRLERGQALFDDLYRAFRGLEPS